MHGLLLPRGPAAQELGYVWTGELPADYTRIKVRPVNARKSLKLCRAEVRKKWKATPAKYGLT